MIFHFRRPKYFFETCSKLYKNFYPFKFSRSLFAKSDYSFDQKSSLSVANLPQKKMSQFILPVSTPISLLDCAEAFESLTPKEKLYAHHLSRASWYGGLIVLPQTSPESPLIFILLHKLFSSQSIESLKHIAINKCGFKEEEFSAFLIYSCGIFFYMGNFKSEGLKFVPDVPKEKFEKLVLSSTFSEKDPEKSKLFLSMCLEKMYSLNDNEIQIGFPYIGTTTYLSKNFTEKDNDVVKNFYERHNLEAYNTRTFKTVDEAGNSCFEIRLASVLQSGDEEEKKLLFSENVGSNKFIITRGDYSELLSLVNQNLSLAKDYAANEKEEQMILHYIRSFRTGSMQEHKEGSTLWVKDKGPIVETYIGFIETYRDPAGMRGEFEGFVSVVNKQQSEKFSRLVEEAEQFLGMLPWPKSYEKDRFLLPDFTSLDILTYAASDVPVGINIPNYVDIKQNVGFKNVSLGNVISMRRNEPPNYLCKEDQDLFMKHFSQALELQVGLHELLGHGSGKLFQKNKNGGLNFDVDAVLHLEKQQKVSSWYEFGESYDSVFGALSNPYEECKAECVGLFLCTEPQVLKIFVEDEKLQEDVMYVNWIMVVLAGLSSLVMYEPKAQSWLQAHSQAAYVILQVLLQNSEGFIRIEEVQGSDGKPDLLFALDRSKIRSIGKPCIGQFLKKLQLYKSIADVESAKAMFERYSLLTPDYLAWREIVLARRKPRRLCVQGNTTLQNGEVKLKNYEATVEGMIESWVDRFQEDPKLYSILEDIWAKDKHHFS